MMAMRRRSNNRSAEADPTNRWPVPICLALLLFAGCKPTNDMDEKPSLKPHKPSAFFPDGASARPLVAGTIPRPPNMSPGMPYVAMASISATTAPSSSIPFPITQQILKLGQQRYDIYCSVCHGRLGNGDGMIVRRGFTAPPSFHIQRLRDAPDSHFYEVISNGYGAMFSYNDRVSPDERWMITAYIRALQLAAQQARTLSQDQVRKLQGTRP
jgi:mono/diheme cytochrome c family protein